ncbi:MurR/RpiR family transcriptional regulator [Halanaerobaculum tunisiense]
MRLQEIINDHYDQLNENDLYILEYILNHKQECSQLGINPLADKCNVSRTTIFRLAKKLGFKGYSEFKFYLKWEEEENEQEKTDYTQHLYNDITETIKLIKERDFTEICEVLYQAERVFVYSTGAAQMNIAQELKRTFLITHNFFHIIDRHRELEVITPSITKEDVVIFISLSGNTIAFQSCLNEITMKGINTISITRLNNNQLAQMTDHNLYVMSSPWNYKDKESHSFSMFFILIEVLFRQYINYLQEQEGN